MLHPIGVLTVGGPAEDHTLSSPGDVDSFVIDLPGDGQYYNLDLGAPQPVDEYMHTDAVGGITRDEPGSRIAGFLGLPIRGTDASWRRARGVGTSGCKRQPGRRPPTRTPYASTATSRCEAMVSDSEATYECIERAPRVRFMAIPS